MPKGIYPHKRKTIEERFWPKLIKRGEDECWGWSGTKNSDGYGKLWNGKTMDYAHRISFVIHGNILEPHDSYHGRCVLHKCDNPECCNPKHLFAGTNEDNIHDMLAKKRHGHGVTSGESHHEAKLTEKDILTIRAWKGTQQSIAKKLGIRQPTVSAIQLRKSWKHVK